MPSQLQKVVNIFVDWRKNIVVDLARLTDPNNLNDKLNDTTIHTVYSKQIVDYHQSNDYHKRIKEKVKLLFAP